MKEDVPSGLDPQLVDFLQAVKESGAPALYTMSAPDARAAYLEGVRRVSAEAPGIDRTVSKSIETSSGPVAVRLYYPNGGGHASVPLVLYFHGGGWTFGSIESHDNVCRTLCAQAESIVASVDYRLAPEHKFPQAVDDAIAASLWVFDNAEVLGADEKKIVLAGDSAGATIATVAAMAARDRGRPDIQCQLLIYPATDMSMSYPSHRKFGDGYRLTRSLMVWSSTNYLRDGNDILDARSSPLFADDHSGLPPTIVITAGYDPLKDEGAAYAAKLQDAGVGVDYRCFHSLIHGFINLTGIAGTAAMALDEIILMLKKKL